MVFRTVNLTQPQQWLGQKLKLFSSQEPKGQ